MAELTYCSNIHPGESWADVMHNLDSHALDVKKRLGNDAPFPLGLRIAHQAAQEADEKAIAQFRDWCRQHNAYLLTINGFPYGAFHHQRVKENVYLPDWREPERVHYSRHLGDLAVALQPDAERISISTVPIAFKPAFQDSDWPAALANVRAVAEHYYRLYQSSGVKLILAIEPEPACVLETTDEAVDFFVRLDLPEHLREHVGLCFDCCHQAVEFEAPATCLQKIQAADIPIGKVQVSSALRAQAGEFDKLLAFEEPVYLHQSIARCADTGELYHYTDLPDFRAALEAGQRFSECRTHFHIPIFLEHLGEVGTTQPFLRELLPQLPKDTPLEVETYSFAAIPEHLRRDSMGESIAGELEWVDNILKP